MGYDWKTDKYFELVENTNNVFLRDYIDIELNYLTHKIDNPNSKTFIDIGAGYGRVVPVLSKIAKKIIAVEIDEQMLNSLYEKSEAYKNCSIIKGDAQKLSDSLKEVNVGTPVIMCLQNSLGTPYGDPYKIISEMVKVAEKNKGELIISLFTQESLKDCGISIYSSIEGLVGEIDLEKTDFTKGDFVSKTGYKSHWWTPLERDEIVKMVGGKVISEVNGKCFYILHVKY